MGDAPTWTNEKRKLSDLIPWPRNPRKIQKAEADRLAQSFKDFGQPETIAIGPGNEVYNGHQRLRVWADQYGDIEVDVRVSSRPLTEKERERLTVVLHRGAVGEFDFEALATWDLGELLEWGFEERDFGVQNVIDLGFGEEPSGFASGEQFGDGVQVIITTTQERLDATKADLFALCDREGLQYRVRSA